MKHKYTESSPKRISAAVTAIYGAFDWSATEEGGSYWQDVVRKLQGHQEAAQKELGCVSEIAELRARLDDLESRCSR